MSDVIITRKVHFNSAHRLHSEQLSEAENVTVFGKCNNLNGHGHDYFLTVALKGSVDPITGMLYNLSDLAKILDEKILKPFDHKHLNLDTDYFKSLVPTAENIAIVCYDILAATALVDILYYVELQETPNNFARYYGPNLDR